MDAGRVPSSNSVEGAGHRAISEISLQNHDGNISSGSSSPLLSESFLCKYELLVSISSRDFALLFDPCFLRI